MPSFPVKLLIIRPRSADGADPEKEFGVPGVLEWNDSDFTLKRDAGAIVLQLETKLAHTCIDVAMLFGADVQLQFSRLI